MIYHITPVPKPRMTQRDKWKQRPCVMEYRAFKDRLREKFVKVQSGDCITFFMPMPESWSKKKKEEMDGMPHKAKKDVDNLLKAVLDALYEDDSHIWDIRVKKIWSYEGAIKIEKMRD